MGWWPGHAQGGGLLDCVVSLRGGQRCVGTICATLKCSAGGRRLVERCARGGRGAQTGARAQQEVRRWRAGPEPSVFRSFVGVGVEVSPISINQSIPLRGNTFVTLCHVGSNPQMREAHSPWHSASLAFVRGLAGPLVGSSSAVAHLSTRWRCWAGRRRRWILLSTSVRSSLLALVRSLASLRFAWAPKALCLHWCCRCPQQTNRRLGLVI
jgi:hypothetical protein